MRQKEIARCLKALANERRVRILSELRRVPGLTVGDLSRILKLSYPSTSRHIQKLAACDLIMLEQRSLNVSCYLNKTHPLLRVVLPLSRSS
ncbi:MAG: ArsR family transcriptional regulator [Candidatus Uhrbacteria bacterium]